jgi:peptidoglycan/LPS O-acetylase OafA/YrhL
LLGIAGAATPGFRGQPFEWSVPQILSHAGYLTGLLGYEWLNIVYWTLAIEFQFYILIAIFFPLLATRRPTIQISAIIVCAAAPLLTPSIPAPTAEAFFPTPILPLLPAFSAGVLTFKFLTGRAQDVWYWPALGALTLLTAWRDGIPFAVAAGATAAIIATVHLPRIRPLAYLGAISYSLYLVHVPISVRLSNLAGRLGSSLALEVAVIFAALGVCIAAAAVFHWLVNGLLSNLQPGSGTGNRRARSRRS